MISNEMIVENMRHMAWERAKGELRSMLHTFWEHKDESSYEELKDAIESFIKRVEDEGLHE